MKLSIAQLLLFSIYFESLYLYCEAHLHPVVSLGVDVDGSAEVIH